MENANPFNRKTNVNKIKIMPIRVTKEEHYILKRIALEMGCTLSAFVMNAVKDYLAMGRTFVNEERSLE